MKSSLNKEFLNKLPSIISMFNSGREWQIEQLREHFLNQPKLLLVDDLLCFYKTYADTFRNIYEHDYDLIQKQLETKNKFKIEHLEERIEHLLDELAKEKSRKSLWGRLFGRK